MLVVGGGVVAAPVINFHAGPVQAHCYAPVTSITRGIRAVVAENVIAGSIVLYALEHFAEIVGIEKGAAAGVGGQGHESFLSGEVRVQSVQRGLSRIWGRTPKAGVL